MPSITTRCDRRRRFPHHVLLATTGFVALSAPATASVVAKANATIDLSTLKYRSLFLSDLDPSIGTSFGLTRALANWNGAIVEDDDTTSAGHPVASAVAEIGGARAIGLLHGSRLLGDAWSLGPSGVAFTAESEGSSSVSWVVDRASDPLLFVGQVSLSFSYEINLTLRTDGAYDHAAATADIAFNILGGVSIAGPPLRFTQSAHGSSGLQTWHRSGTATFTFTLPPPTSDPGNRFVRFELSATALTSADSVPSAGALATALAALLVAGRRRRVRLL